MSEIMDKILSRGYVEITNGFENTIDPDIGFDDPREAWNAVESELDKYCKVEDEVSADIDEEDNRTVRLLKCDYNGKQFYVVTADASGFGYWRYVAVVKTNRDSAVRAYNSYIDDVIDEIDDIMSVRELPKKVKEELEEMKEDLEESKL